MPSARAILALVLAAAACGGGGGNVGDGSPVTRRECIGFVAHQMMLENVAGLGDDELGNQLGKELTAQRFKNEEEALEVIRVYERGSLTPAEGEGERRIARCLAERSRANVRCAVRAVSIAEIERCPR